ncbi:CHASE domain-containing protein [Qipengyuania atrilutea]|uniref:histidine kinase n=1 Tax=Qipengyuania atrilutea TaxID=2744473 RepID=A0A850H3B6_9SPHN|nr:CHASE domain-containing protein [Actirhodobacter atriluteus]NVD45057.1 CHASE domain-containing protein [Actirhodobacter atriluteus]
MAGRNSDPASSRRLLLRFPRALPVAIFVLITAITAFSVFAIERGERSGERAEMARLAESAGASLELNAATNASYLRAAAALIGALDEVSNASFGEIIRELRLERSYSGAEGIGWAPYLETGSPGAATAAQQRFQEETGRPIYPSLLDRQSEHSAPVMFLVPDNARNDVAIGFDMYSNERRREAMDRAAAENAPVFSGPVQLVQDNPEPRPGFLAYMPVFAGDDGQGQLRGFLYSPFNAQTFLSSAVPDDDPVRGGMGVYLFDGAPSDQALLAALPSSERTGRYFTKPLTIGNQRMTLVVESARSEALSKLSMLTLLFGLLVASLLMLVVRLLTKQAREDEKSLAWLQEQNSIRNSLTRELNHRVKNTLANVLSIMALTRKRASSLDEFANALDGRIRALSATHDLLTQSDWNTTPIEAVVDAELAPYAQSTDSIVRRSGPDVELAPNDALSLGMALHELATNAAKYGALSRPGGTVAIDWSLTDTGLARLHWEESGGPAVEQMRGRGFGTDLIEKIVAHELRHPVELSFARTGVTCTLHVPVRQPSEFRMRAGKNK